MYIVVIIIIFIFIIIVVVITGNFVPQHVTGMYSLTVSRVDVHFIVEDDLLPIIILLDELENEELKSP